MVSASFLGKARAGKVLCDVFGKLKDVPDAGFPFRQLDSDNKMRYFIIIFRENSLTVRQCAILA